jgi:hypothetical protein
MDQKLKEKNKKKRIFQFLDNSGAISTPNQYHQITNIDINEKKMI